jgi:hypothetical protein
MKKKHVSDRQKRGAVEIFRPKPDMLYSLDVAAHLAGVPRRAILIYCRAGLVRPVCLPPYGAMAFTEEAIYAMRQVERMRAMRGADMVWIKTVFELLEEVERLRAEVRFLRNS